MTKIGQYTPAELSGMVTALAARAQTATQAQAQQLLPEAQRIIQTIEQELQLDQAALAQARQQALAQKQQLDTQFDHHDAQREALQAAEVEAFKQQLRLAQEQRKQQGLWTRLTTSDATSKQLKAQLEAIEEQHDQHDARDFQLRQQAVQQAMAAAQLYEQEAQQTQGVYRHALEFAQMLQNRARGWGPGSLVFSRVQKLVDMGLRANNRDMDAKAAMALTAGFSGTSVEQLNALKSQIIQVNRRAPFHYRITDEEAIGLLACGSVTGHTPADQMFDLWCQAIDHARREGGYSNDEDARAMVVFCTAVIKLPVSQVQYERRAINVEYLGGRDPEGAGLILLTHTLARVPVEHLAQAYHTARRVGMNMEECAYVAMAVGLGNRDPNWVVQRFRSLSRMVSSHVRLPYGYEEQRDAIRDASATLAIAAAVSSHDDQQLIELFNFTEPFRPMFGQADYEARGALVVGAVHPSSKLF
jgi:hypothetical protein